MAVKRKYFIIWKHPLIKAVMKSTRRHEVYSFLRHAYCLLMAEDHEVKERFRDIGILNLAQLMGRTHATFYNSVEEGRKLLLFRDDLFIWLYNLVKEELLTVEIQFGAISNGRGTNFLRKVS